MGVQKVSLNIGFLFALPSLLPFLTRNHKERKRCSIFWGTLPSSCSLSRPTVGQAKILQFCHKFDYDWKIKKRKSTISCFDIFHWLYFKSSCSVFSPAAWHGQSNLTWLLWWPFMSWAPCSWPGETPGLSLSTLRTQTAPQLWGLAWKTVTVQSKWSLQRKFWSKVCSTVKVESKWRNGVLIFAAHL